MEQGFVAPSINIENLDPELAPVNIVTQTRDVNIQHMMSNSFGFGGTNGSVIFSKTT